MMDNASPNNHLVKHLAARLQEEDVKWDARQHRLRCHGHFINLAARAFLFGKNKDATQDDDEDDEDAEEDAIADITEKEFESWRKNGRFGSSITLL